MQTTYLQARLSKVKISFHRIILLSNLLVVRTVQYEIPPLNSLPIKLWNSPPLCEKLIFTFGNRACLSYIISFSVTPSPSRAYVFYGCTLSSRWDWIGFWAQGPIFQRTTLSKGSNQIQTAPSCSNAYFNFCRIQGWENQFSIRCMCMHLMTRIHAKSKLQQAACAHLQSQYYKPSLSREERSVGTNRNYRKIPNFYSWKMSR